MSESVKKQRRIIGTIEKRLTALEKIVREMNGSSHDSETLDCGQCGKYITDAEACPVGSKMLCQECKAAFLAEWP